MGTDRRVDRSDLPSVSVRRGPTCSRSRPTAPACDRAVEARAALARMVHEAVAAPVVGAAELSA
jgi:hypothetical protein